MYRGSLRSSCNKTFLSLDNELERSVTSTNMIEIVALSTGEHVVVVQSDNVTDFVVVQ